MSIVTIIFAVLLVLLLFGGVSPYRGGPYLGTGWYGGGAIGLIIVILLILILFGRV